MNQIDFKSCLAVFVCPECGKTGEVATKSLGENKYEATSYCTTCRKKYDVIMTVDSNGSFIPIKSEVDPQSAITSSTMIITIIVVIASAVAGALASHFIKLF